MILREKNVLTRRYRFPPEFLPSALEPAASEFVAEIQKQKVKSIFESVNILHKD